MEMVVPDRVTADPPGVIVVPAMTKAPLASARIVEEPRVRMAAEEGTGTMLSLPITMWELSGDMDAGVPEMVMGALGAKIEPPALANPGNVVGW